MTNISIVGSSDGPAVDVRELEEHLDGSPVLNAKFGAKANAASLAGKLDKSEAAATYTPFSIMGGVFSRANGSFTIGLGDSHTAPGELTARLPYWELVAAISDQKLARFDNAGISGNTVQQMSDRLDVDVINKRPDRVIFLAGTNNMGDTNISLAWNIYKSILDRLTAAGIGVGLVSIPPQTTAVQNIKTNITAWNSWIKTEAAKRGMPYADIWTPLNDGNGNYQAAYTTDNIHMSQTGAKVAADTTWNSLKTYWPMQSPVRLYTAGDTNSLIPNTNATFTDANTDGTPDGWATSGVGSVGTLSIITDPAAVGNVLRMTRTTNTGVLSAKYPISGRTPGETMEFAVKFRSNSADNIYNFYCTASAADYTLLLNKKILVDWKQSLGGFYTAYGQITLPANATRAEFVLQTAGGTGTMDWAQPTWRKIV